MQILIKLEKPAFNKSPFGNSKPCVIVEFPNCISTSTKATFKWLPTYKQLEEIKEALNKVEKISWGK